MSSRKMEKLCSLILAVCFFCASARAEAGSRIISLTPGATEILFALGLEDGVVGVTTACDFPGRARRKEKVGQYGHPDIEKILNLKPDLVVSVGLEGAPEVEEMKKLKLKLVSYNPRTLAELLEAIEEIGELTGKGREAAALTGEMRRKIVRISEKTKPLSLEEKPRVFVEIWDDPLITLGPGSFIDELIEIAGGCNIAHDLPRSYSRISAEVVIKRNPDCIILARRLTSSKGAASELSRRVGWKEVTAVKTKRIFDDINPDIILRPSPRLVEGLEALYERIHQK